MPKLVGNKPFVGCLRLDDNAETPPGMVRVSYAQAAIIDEHSGAAGRNQLVCSLDTTDSGCAGTYAKRWYRWFASIECIEQCPRSTKKMREAALQARIRRLPDDLRIVAKDAAIECRTDALVAIMAQVAA